MPRTISIGNQIFSTLREKNCFYVDKTSFIKEWWDGSSVVTLITRPRRFGKTLNMNMLECFFSNHYQNRSDLFEGLSIWTEEKFRNLQGTYPVIFLSFANIKQNTYQKTLIRIKKLIDEVSVIGYRPTVKQHFEGYPEECKLVLEKSVPGLSGIGSIVFRNEEEILQQFEDKKSFHQNVIAPYKAALEVWYVQHKSLGLYFKLIFMTAEAVLHPNSHKWRTAFKDLPPVPAELDSFI